MSEDESEVEDDPPKPDESSFHDPSDSLLLKEESDELPPKSPMGVTELDDDMQEKLSEFKQQAAESLENNDLPSALNAYNKAISMGAASALLYSKRADLLLRMGRPRACIEDCNEALKLNPDSGRAYRVRGIAYRRLQNWEMAHADLSTAQKIDYDEETESKYKREVDEKWKHIAELRRDYQMKIDDLKRQRRIREINRRRKAAAAHSKAADAGHCGAADDCCGGKAGCGDATSGARPGAAAGAGGFMPEFLNDPELQKAFSNPKLMQAMSEMMSNPAAAMKYMSDPEIGPVLMKLMGKMGGGGGAGGMPFGFGAGGAGAGGSRSSGAPPGHNFATDGGDP